MSEQSKIYPIVQAVAKTPYADKRERYEYQYPVILKYLRNILAGWHICDFFHSIKADNIVLYAVTEFTELICDDINDNDECITIPYICDKNESKFKCGYKGYQVVGINTLVNDYREGKIGKILICSISHMNEIFEDLSKQGVKLEDMISVSAAIFSR